jgi:hypothetical protein
VKALIASTTLIATITVCLTFGIACGYAAVMGILRAFGHRSPKPVSASLSAVQVGSGD